MLPFVEAVSLSFAVSLFTNSWPFYAAATMLLSFPTRLDLYHTHSLRKPLSYYLEPIELPPEDLEPIPEKMVGLDLSPILTTLSLYRFYISCILFEGES